MFLLKSSDQAIPQLRGAQIFRALFSQKQPAGLVTKVPTSTMESLTLLMRYILTHIYVILFVRFFWFLSLYVLGFNDARALCHLASQQHIHLRLRCKIYSLLLLVFLFNAFMGVRSQVVPPSALPISSTVQETLIQAILKRAPAGTNLN